MDDKLAHQHAYDEGGDPEKYFQSAPSVRGILCDDEGVNVANGDNVTFCGAVSYRIFSIDEEITKRNQIRD